MGIGVLQVLLILSVLPSMVLGYYIYLNDKVEKEPAKLLIQLLLGGVLSVVTVLLITFFMELLIPITKNLENSNLIGIFIYSFFCVALIEEGCKYFFVRIFTWNNKEFNHIYDAVVYCVFVSLGFATVENILYVLQGGLVTAIARAIFSVPGHTFFGITMGYYYGLSKKAKIDCNKAKESNNGILALIVPILLHGFFDFCLLSKRLIFLIPYFIFIILLYIFSFKNVKKIASIKENFVPDKPVILANYCSNCGSKVIGNFCFKCGAKVR